jgi:methyl-accepting chemotaxis protein
MTALNAEQIKRVEQKRFGIFIGLRWKLMFAFVLLFTAVFMVVAVAASNLLDRLFQLSTEVAVANLRRDLESIALATSAGINGDIHQALYESGEVGDAAFMAINAFLRQMTRSNSKVVGIYTYVPHPDDPNLVQFVVTSALPPGGQMTELDTAIDDIRVCKALQEGAGFKENYEPGVGMRLGLTRMSSSPQLRTDDYGTWLSGFAPIRNSNGEIVGAVGVDMCADDVVGVQNTIREAQINLTNSLIPGFVIGIISVFVVTLIVSFNITSPIRLLTRFAERIAEGDYTQSFDQVAKGVFRDEVFKLADVFKILQEKVRQREENLKQQVAELQIMIDESKRDTHVQEIVESDFFRELQGKAANMRTRRSALATGSHPAASAADEKSPRT